MIRNGKRALWAAPMLTFAAWLGGKAQAQVQPIVLPRGTNVNDTSCFGFAYVNNCGVGANRRVTTVSESMSPGTQPNTTILNGLYNVQSTGSLFSQDLLTTVTAQTSYTGSYDNYVAPTSYVQRGAGYALADFQHFSNISATISAINFQYRQNNVTILTPSPTTLLNGNSVKVAGTFADHTSDGLGVIYGDIGGTVTATTNAGQTFGGPLAVRYDFTQNITTQFDRTGLITPKVSVTGGITMAGSKVTGLGAGTDATDAVNKQQLDSETTARITGNGILSRQIASEYVSRTYTDNLLATRITDETTARSDRDAALYGRIVGEGTARTTGDSTLDGRIDQEAAARAAAVADLASRIDKVGGGSAVAVAPAALARVAAPAALAAGDAALATSIGTETKLRVDGEAMLAASVDVEARTRDAADQQIVASVTSEADTRGRADAALGASITSERQTRAQADTQLTGAIGGEAATRAQQDTQLSQRIDTSVQNETALANGLVAEGAARQAADLAIATKVDALSGRLDQIDGRLDRLDRHVSGATAVAVALGGNAFLPDMKFNLTANVGTYEGAHAGALQVGALVSRHVALNGGVATGFNRGGGTAARAGVTLGW